MKNLIILSLFFFSFPILAQEYGTLRGRITDEFSGDPLKYAKLSLQIDGAFVAKVETNKHGDFLFSSILDGYYDLTIKQTGYSPLKITNVPIIKNKDIEFNPSFEAEGFDLDTIVFTYSELQKKETSKPSLTKQKRAKRRQTRAARKLD